MTNNTTDTKTVHCDMSSECKDPVTHIGDKGYAYCAEHGPQRRSSGYEHVRKMRAWERRWLSEGKSLPSYRVAPEPKGN